MKYHNWKEDIIERYENPTSGLTTAFVSKYSLLYEWLNDYYTEQGKNLEYEVRGYRWSKSKKSEGFTFKHGIGYDWIDRDLLDGNGSGKTQRLFNEFVERKQDEFEKRTEEFEKQREKNKHNSMLKPKQESLSSRSTQAKQISDEQQRSTDKERDKSKDDKDKGKE